MKEHPALFYGPMVRAIIRDENPKTQTRRVVKLPQSKHFEFRWDNARVDLGLPATGRYMHIEFRHRDGEWEGCADRVFCPFGKPGDRLWVRETWYCDLPELQKGPYLEVPGAMEEMYYLADGIPDFEGGEGDIMWKPSIHMPHWASRITLEVVSVRVERLQDISEADAIAEGLSSWSKDGNLTKWGIADKDRLPGNDDDGWQWKEWETDPRLAFRRLWEAINGPGSWEANPHVWVVEFKKVEVKG